MISGADLLVVGRVQKPHGVRGEFAVTLETDRPAEVFRAGRVLWVGGPDGQRLTVERARPFKAGLLVKTAEHSSRTDATDALRGQDLLIPRAEAPPLADGEVWTHELVGMAVFAGTDRVGSVREVYDAPAGGHLLAIARPDRADLLVPFVADLVCRVDRERREVELEPREGLLEL